MKINKLRLKNLNSLKEEFDIDFETGKLSQSGIFAITGPTGAGKSTILDAICVSLYGQTPRLGRDDCAELLSRHTGECFAEVEFTVKTGRFRSKWSIHRAKGKSDGKLQQAKMELSEIKPEKDKPTIIEDVKNRVILKVEQLTGLDFIRFTRSVLLAQGSFAAFLNAKENERADLLEKMTGTEIYSLISKKTFEKAKTEKQKLEQLELLMNAIVLISPDKIKELGDQISELKDKITKNSEMLKDINSQIAWLKEIDSIEAVIKKSLSELENVKQEQDKFAKDFEKLDKAISARVLYGEYEYLEHMEREFAEKNNEISNLRIIIPKSEKDFDFEKRICGSLNEEFEKFKLDKEKQEIKISEAETKDQEIKNHQKTLQEKKNILSKVQSESIISKANKKEVELKISQSMQIIKDCQTYQDDNEKDALIQSELSVISKYFEDLSKIRRNLINKTESIDKTEKKLIKSNQEEKRLITELKSAQKKVEIQLAKKEDFENQLLDILKDKSLEDIEKEGELIKTRLNDIENLQETGKQIESAIVKHSDCEQKIKDIDVKLQKKEIEKQNLLNNLDLESIILTELEEKQRLELLQGKYAKDRQMLSDKSPCPLCGSLDHPWIKFGVPQINNSKAILTSQKKKIEVIKDNLKQTEIYMAELITLKKQLLSAIDEYRGIIGELTKKWQEIAVAQKIEKSPECWHFLLELSNQVRFCHDEYQKRLNLIKQINKETFKLTYESNVLTKELNKVSLNLQKIQNEIQMLNNDRQRFQNELAELTNSSMDIKSAISQILEKLGEQIPGPDDESRFIKKLKNKQDKYIENQKKITLLEKEIVLMRENLKETESNINSLGSRETEEKDNIQIKEKEISELLKERENLVGCNDVSKMRNLLKHKNLDFENKIKKSQDKITSILSDLTSKKDLFAVREKEKGQLHLQIVKTNEIFELKLTKSGFINKDSFKQAILKEDEITNLEKIRKNLTERETKNSTRLKDAQQSLTAKRQTPMTDETLDIVIEKEKSKKKEQEEITKELGGLLAVLKSQEELRLRQDDQLKKIAIQKKESQRWDRLNYLIGSADGKKFKRFAQSLTLEYLISLANMHLVKLNDRYMIKHKGDEELGLEVIDTYQADTCRPTATLSGGESFLVSLALSLGLSGIACQNTTIDSLFLDEGFGTLDAETLEIALAALDSLNASGKAIGIISHVEVLKERIPNQIQVIKLSGGVSKLEIVG